MDGPPLQVPNQQLTASKRHTYFQVAGDEVFLQNRLRFLFQNFRREFFPNSSSTATTDMALACPHAARASRAWTTCRSCFSCVKTWFLHFQFFHSASNETNHTRLFCYQKLLCCTVCDYRVITQNIVLHSLWLLFDYPVWLPGVDGSGFSKAADFATLWRGTHLFCKWKVISCQKYDQSVERSLLRYSVYSAIRHRA